MSSFSTEGFCSSAARRNKKIIRDNSREWMAYFTILNKCLQKYVFSVGGVTGTLLSKEVVASAIYLRSVNSFQGVMLLAERGMHMPGFTIVRSILEDSLCMEAIYSNWEEFRNAFSQDCNASRLRQMKYLVNLQKFDKESVKVLHENIAELSLLKPKMLDIKEMATKGLLKNQYFLYQVVSSNASHCTADSLRCCIVVNEKGSGYNGFKYGPACKEAVDALLWSGCSAVIPIALAYAEITNNAEMISEISDHARSFKEMPSKELEMIQSFRGNT